LKPIASGDVVRLPDDVSFVVDKAFGNKSEHRILKGDYRAVFADENGAYYQGAPTCFRRKLLAAGMLKEELVGKIIDVADCGLYLPNDPGKSAKIYVVLGSYVSRTMGHSEAEIEAAIARGVRPSSTASDGALNTAVTQAVINRPLSPVQGGVAAGVAAGVATGIVYAIGEAEKGRYLIREDQPDPGQLSHLVHGPAAFQ
jgi:hypothetical protein